ARSRLTRMMLEKVENDNFLNQIDHNEWYRIPDLQQLDSIQHLFLHLNEDAETKQFIDNCIEKSEWFMTELFNTLMLSLLKYFMAITSINGLLQRGSMFVYSQEQFKNLIDFETRYGGLKLNNLLDLGAGDGAVTSKMAPFFENVYTTEMSATMRWRLRQKGFKVVDVNEWDKIPLDTSMGSDPDSEANQNVKFDAISVLNLLDRCDKPLTILQNIKNSLVKNGLLIVAIVLPFKPFVEYNNDNQQKESLFNFTVINQQPVQTGQFCHKNECKKFNRVNAQINYLIESVFAPIGFDLVKFTRLPYLCEGNLAQSYYYMIDYVFVFRIKMLATLFYVPNVLNYIRFILLLIVIYSIGKHPIRSFLLNLLAGNLDMIDGIYARNNKQSSKFGAFMDHGMDRLSTSILFFYLATRNRKYWVIFFTIQFVELIMDILMAYQKNYENVIKLIEISTMKDEDKLIQSLKKEIYLQGQNEKIFTSEISQDLKGDQKFDLFGLILQVIWYSGDAFYWILYSYEFIKKESDHSYDNLTLNLKNKQSKQQRSLISSYKNYLNKFSDHLNRLIRNYFSNKYLPFIFKGNMIKFIFFIAYHCCFLGAFLKFYLDLVDISTVFKNILLIEQQFKDSNYSNFLK
ncbi:unnamed protein product, partial [Brachionus calyciflorus]